MSSDEQKAASLLVIVTVFAVVWLFLTDWPPPPTGSTGAYLFLRLAT